MALHLCSQGFSGWVKEEHSEALVANMTEMLLVTYQVLPASNTQTRAQRTCQAMCTHLWH